MSARHHSREFKLDLCSRITSNVISKAQACREYALAPSLLDRWCQLYREKGSDAFHDRKVISDDKDARIAQLEQALGQAYLDLKIVKAALEKGGGVVPQKLRDK
jgi:transposase